MLPKQPMSSDGLPFGDWQRRWKPAPSTTTALGWVYDMSGPRQIAVMVIDVFGVDTTIVINVGSE